MLTHCKMRVESRKLQFVIFCLKTPSFLVDKGRLSTRYGGSFDALSGDYGKHIVLLEKFSTFSTWFSTENAPTNVENFSYSTFLR